MNLNTITLQYSGVRGQQKNTSSPFRKEISTPEELAEIAEFDHVCAVYADGKNTKGRMVRGYRSRKTFLEANCLPQDCDNANSDPLAPDIPPEEWKTPADVRAAFPGVPFYVVYSRNHMKEKNSKPARPKFHTYFVTRKITNTATMDALKKQVQEYFPAFDKEALDSARFLFGVENPQVEYYDGDTPLDVFMENLEKLPEQIPEGQRNGTISRYAARVFKKYGDTDEAERLIMEANETRCLPPMEDSEVQGILASARSFFHDTIEKDPNYIGPEEYAAMDFAGSGKKKPVTSEDIKEILNRMNITVRLNVLSGMVEITGMPPQYSKANAANVLPVLLSDYMTTHGMKFTRQGLDDSLVLIEDENRFNPIADMLNTVRHDGTDRLAELAEIAGIAEDETACLYLRKWLHQSVAMALNDDTDPYGADGVLVIQNPQGAGKTLLFSKLALYADWFAEGISIDLDKKDSVIQATGCWIAELGELDSTLKREQLSLKAFITSRTDTYRQPYARAATRKPRRTSFCATVNPTEFLNDETGSRRWWVIRPSRIDIDRLKGLSREWVCQLWAQVYSQLYLPNPQGFRLTEDERKKLTADNEQFSKPLPGETEILDKLEWESPVKQWKWYKVTQVRDLLNLKPLTTAQVGRALTKISTHDCRVQTKAPGNVKQYLLPPMCRGAGYFHSVEDFDPVLAPDHPVPLTGVNNLTA